ncbi:MAG: hypothetical protein WBB28_17465 [Crinalium sp.]
MPVFIASYVRIFSNIRLVWVLVLLTILLQGCQSSRNSSATWKIYRNPRYQFEFPYPSNWIATAMPDNRDGQAFRDPQQPEIEIRGWAEHRLSGKILKSRTSTAKNTAQQEQLNFTTQQGVTGQLQVKLGSDRSIMALSINRGLVVYHWRAQAPSKQFTDYYRFFYYIASNYSLPQKN